MATNDDITTRIRTVLIDSLSLGIQEEDLQFNESLDQVMSLDSLAILEFLTALEREFGVALDQDRLELALLRNLPALADYIQSLLRVTSVSDNQT